MKRTQILLTNKLYAALKKLSEETELSMSELIRQAVELLLKYYARRK